MKKLFLLRHAHAVNSSDSDIKRVLSEDGILKCNEIASFLEPYMKDIDLVLSSSAIRTKQTIESVIRILNSNVKIHFTKELYNIPEEELLQYLCNIEHDLDIPLNNIILVGHNPAISNLGVFLAGNSLDLPEYFETIKGFSPGSLALYHCNINSWNELEQYNSVLKSFWR